MNGPRKVKKRLRKFLGLWWIEPIEETIRELGKIPYRHVPSKPPSNPPPGYEPRITRIG